MPDLLLKLARASPRDRIQRITLPVEAFALAGWDTAERPQLELTREQAERWCAELARVLYDVTLARAVTADCH